MNFSEIDDRLTYYNTNVQLWEHLKGRVDQALDARNKIRDAISDTKAFDSYVETFRNYVLEQFGGLPNAFDDGPPAATVSGEVEQESFKIQNLILETRPHVRATANLYLPKNVTGKAPAVLFLCGHSDNGKAAGRYQTVCRLLAARGFVVLALDPTGQGERLNYYHPDLAETQIRIGTGDHEYVGLQCTLQGHNLSRYMLHDAIRAVDFLVSHPLVDASRIGITGNSGGGTQSSLMMLIEPRLAAAAPGTFVTSRRAIFDSGYSQDAEQIWPGFTEAGYDHVDLMIAFAPKPLCVLAVEFDFFPIEGTRETMQRAKRFWELFGKEQSLRYMEDRALHGFTRPLADAAVDFFVENLGGNPQPIKEECEPLPDRQLYATQSGQVLGDFPKSKTILDENREAFASVKVDKEKGRTFLKEAVLKSRRPVDLNLRITRSFPLADVIADYGFWWSQEGLINSGLLFRSTLSQKKKLPVTIALWEDGSREVAHHDAWIRRELSHGRAVYVLNVTGMGPIEPSPFRCDIKNDGSLFRTNDDLRTLGDSLCALRTYDVLRCLDVLEKWEFLDEGDVQLYLNGRYGIYGALASVLDKRIHSLRWDDPLCSYAELLKARFYNNLDVKSLVIPKLLCFADWTDLVEL